MRNSKCIIFKSPTKEMKDLFNGKPTKKDLKTVENPFKIKKEKL